MGKGRQFPCARKIQHACAVWNRGRFNRHESASSKGKLRMLHTALISLCVLLFGVELSFGQPTGGGVRPIEPDYNGRCEDMTVNYCANIRVENTVYLPNSRGHDTQEAAFEELDDYFPLLNNNSGCSNGLYHFLCSYYFPLCYTDPLSNKPTKLKPCRSLCEYVRPPCEAVLVANNLTWPAFFNCSLGDFGDGEKCFGPSDPSTAIFTTVGPSTEDTSAAITNSISILSTVYGAVVAATLYINVML